MLIAWLTGAVLVLMAWLTGALLVLMACLIGAGLLLGVLVTCGADLDVGGDSPSA